MIGFRTIERRLVGEIMGTDILIRIASSDETKESMVRSIEDAFQVMRQFADQYSRFIKGNLLWRFNQSRGGTVSAEFFDLLVRAKKHYAETQGLFDPSILPALEREGYLGAYGDNIDLTTPSFDELTLDPTLHSTQKPVELKVDFGGFGKGYIVDQVAEKLARKYPHVLVDAGGDIAVHGSDVGRGEAGWIISVEHPIEHDTDLCLLSLSNLAIATSGKNRRIWQSTKGERHHLIDPLTRRSSQSTLLSVTVIAPTTEAADVEAKTLFLMGSINGRESALKRSVPAIFFDAFGTLEINNFAKPYVWNAA
jgi:thiamine biosynthesis lipoprotein